MKYVRLVIGECVSEDQVKELENIAHGFFGVKREVGDGHPEYSILVEDGGNMVIIETRFENRDESLRFHSSREYRQFVAGTQHLLLGNYVVKLFHEN